MSERRDVPSWVVAPTPSTGDQKADQRAAKSMLRWLRACLPGDRLKTWVYLNAVMMPRKILRRAATTFSRFDHVYDVLREFTTHFKGPFAILEFGTAQGYAFAKLLGATRYLGLEEQVTVHGFDSFEGLPEATAAADKGLAGDDWMRGAYRASYDVLRAYCEKRGYRNFRLYRGYFEDSLTPEVIATFRQEQPILVWVDCDLYTSSRTVLERLLPVLRSGCVVYFDDLDFNFASRFTGQARLIHEINRGHLGENVELALDAELSWDSGRIYRLVRFGADEPAYEPLYRRETPPVARPIVDGSPFP